MDKVKTILKAEDYVKENARRYDLYNSETGRRIPHNDIVRLVSLTMREEGIVEAKPTPGEVAAEKLILLTCGDLHFMWLGESGGGQVMHTLEPAQKLEIARSYTAKAIDLARAEAAQAEREACATYAESNGYAGFAASLRTWEVTR
jgi:hypothetical protein